MTGRLKPVYSTADDMVDDCLARATKRIDAGNEVGILSKPDRSNRILLLANLIALSETFMRRRWDE